MKTGCPPSACGGIATTSRTSTRTFERCERAVCLLVDADVLVWFLRGWLSARQASESCAAVELSTIAYVDLVQGVRNKAELGALRRTVRVNGWRILPLTEAIGHRATLAGSTLLTANEKHYRCVPEPSLAIFAPQPEA